MTITPEKLRACADQKMGVAIVPDEARMLPDAMEIADSSARADIESYCRTIGDCEDHGDYRTWWWDVDSIEAEERATVDQALRYLDARGAIEYRTTEGKRAVRFKREVE